MKIFKRMLIIILISILTIVGINAITSKTTAESIDLDLLFWYAYHPDYPFERDLEEISAQYSHGHLLDGGGAGRDWMYNLEIATYMDCINEYGYNIPGSAYDIRGILEVFSEDEIYYYIDGVKHDLSVEHPEVMRVAYQYACIAEDGVLEGSKNPNKAHDIAGYFYGMHHAELRDKLGFAVSSDLIYRRNGYTAADTEVVLRRHPKLTEGTRFLVFFLGYGTYGDQNHNTGIAAQDRTMFIRTKGGQPGECNLKIHKANEANTPLSKVRFMFRRTGGGKSDKYGWIQVVNHAKGAYMKKNGDADNISIVPKDVMEQKQWDIRYTNIQEDATVFETDENGEIYIYGMVEDTGLISGNFEALEMLNPNYGYVISGSNPATFKLNKKEENDVTIQNEKITGNLRLIKRDRRTNEPLAGAGFKFQYIEGNNGNWLKDGNEFEKYTLNYDEAQEYFTDANGEIYLTDLLPGAYKAVETTPPEGYAALDKDKNGLTVYIPPKGTGEITVLNKKVGVFRKIIETTDVGLKNFEFTVREKSIREEYYQYFPNYFNPNDSIYKDPVGNVDFWVRDDHCEIVLKPDDDLRVTDTEDRWEVVGTTRKSRKVTKWREVSDGVDSEGNPKTKWESYEDTEWYDEDVYGWVTHITEWTCTTHGDKFGEFQESAAHQHCDTYNNKKAATKNELRENMEKYHAEREEGVRQTNTVVTDDKGYGDISKLVPDDDDYRGQMQIKEDNVGDNPYFNNDHPNFEDFVYYEKTVWTDVRRRMDIEGFIWEDLPKEGKEACKSREDGDSYYNEGEESLLGGIDVCLKNNAVGIIGKGTITADGRYRIRVGGRNGEDIKWVTTNKAGTYIEFTYNGLKYQCVYVDTANQKNGSNALETEASRREINERFKTITSNAGSIETSSAPTENKIIKYNHGNYESKIDYEVSFNEQIDYDKEALGDGRYNGTQRMVKASERDPETQQTRGNGDSSPCADNCYTYTSKTDGNNYQISARTDQTAFDGIARYTVAEDKIEDVSFGVYEREQPDISVVNDIERVEISVNGEKYIYQYGKKLENPEEILGLDIGVRFQSNTTYKYKREIHGEHVKIDQTEQNSGEPDKFRLKVFYKTVVKNNSTNLAMTIKEMVTQYDARCTNSTAPNERNGQDRIKDETQYMINQLGMNEAIGESLTTGEIIWTTDENSRSNYSNATHSVGDQKYKEAYGLVGKQLEHGEKLTFYTSYTFLKDEANQKDVFKDLIELTKENPDASITLDNNIEINAYTTTWDGQERNVGTDAYAGYDMDSAPGNSNISSKSGYEDDNDEAPSLALTLTDPRKISGYVFEDIPELKNNEYFGNGKWDNNSEPGINNIKVELVEIDNAGNEILENGETKVLMYDWTKQDASDSPKKATTVTSPNDKNGYYEFVGFLPGEYIVKFTWGQEAIYIDPNTGQSEKIYVQQYKGTKFDNEDDRYNKMIQKNSTDGTTKNRWYRDVSGIKYKGYSNAIDDMTTRRKIDSQTENIGQDQNYKGEQYNNAYANEAEGSGNTLVYPDLENAEFHASHTGLITSLESRTPAFDVPIEDDYEDKIDSEDTSKKTCGKNSDGTVYEPEGSPTGNGYTVMDVTDLDFGISERPKTDMQLEKRIDRVKLTLANGTVLVDSTVEWDESSDTGNLVGNIQNVSYPKPQRTNIGNRNNIGIFKIEMDKEILHGATLETTYKLTVKNTSNIDYDVVSEGDYNAYAQQNDNKNKYYKFAETDGNQNMITIAPTKIIEYLDNKMGYRRAPEENAPKENDLWEEITQKNNNRISDLLYDGRFEKSKSEGNSNELYEKGLSDLPNKLTGYNNYLDNDVTVDGGNEPTANIKGNIDNIYKQYRTILRDVTIQNQQNLKDQLKSQFTSEDQELVDLALEPEETKELKFVPSKQLADTETDLNYYNVVELAQLSKSSGSIPENIIVGNTDPTTTGPLNVLKGSPNWTSEESYQIITERDGDYASVITIIPPTGDEMNYKAIAWTVLGISSLGILTAGIVLIRKFVLKGKDK